MNVQTAATNCRQYLARCHADDLPGGDATSVAHVENMLAAIESGEVSGEKAMRWLGWAQATICCRGGATLDELKSVNFAA